jgi:hypothetical protein
VRRVLRAALVAGLVGSGALALAAPASAVTPGGTYVALGAQSRVVDTRTGAGGNHKGAVGAGRGINPLIAGVGHVPATGVGAVVVTLTAVAPTGNGGLMAYGATRPSTTNLQFAAGQAAVSDTAVVPLSRGRINIVNVSSSGSVQIVVDVSGYYASGAASAADPGVFHSVTPTRFVDTRTGGAYGNHKGALPAGAGITPTLAGHAGVPPGPGAVAVTITVLSPTKAGSIIAYRPDEPRQNLPLVHFAAGQRVSAFAVLRLSGGKATLVNTSGGTAHVLVDVAGYYNIGFAQTAKAFQTVIQTRVQTSTVAANANLAVSVAGKGGVPLSQAAAALVTLHVTSPTRGGGLQAWKYGTTRPITTALQFKAGQTTSNVVLVPVSSNGRFAVHNSSGGRLTVVVDVDGYVPSTAIANPPATATARYVRNITDSATANAAVMAGEGTADASKTFVLLHIGAQLNDGTGVALSAIDRRITYGNLVAALNAYLDAYAAAGGHGTVAVGTNNSGNWSQYPAAARGADWATKVIGQLHVPSGGSVVGAADFEAGFASTEPEAASWKASFLSHMPGTGQALVFIGSADFCPKTWTKAAACNFGWTYQNLYKLAGGSRTTVLPQIYVGYMATEWAEIDATGGGGLRFLGSLTESQDVPGTLSPAQGRTALIRAVSSVTATPVGSAAADIHADS